MTAGRTRPLCGIFSKGRSGSTWLGSIVNTHPEVAYRFEPFHRLREDPDVARLRRSIEAGTFDATERDELYAILLRASPLTDRPPFFVKRNARSRGKRLLWPAARRLPPLAPLYGALYTPRGAPVVVLKEVTLEPVMEGLLRAGGTRIVYLVRHPCAVVHSQIRGQEAGVMPTARQGVLSSLLEKHDPALAERVAAHPDATSAAGRSS